MDYWGSRPSSCSLPIKSCRQSTEIGLYPWGRFCAHCLGVSSSKPTIMLIRFGEHATWRADARHNSRAVSCCRWPGSGVQESRAGPVATRQPALIFPWNVHVASDLSRPPVYAHLRDHEVLEDGKPIGRIKEEREPTPGRAWSWYLQIEEAHRAGAPTSGYAASLHGCRLRGGYSCPSAIRSFRSDRDDDRKENHRPCQGRRKQPRSTVRTRLDRHPQLAISKTSITQHFVGLELGRRLIYT
jgi:hypothetical protein